MRLHTFTLLGVIAVSAPTVSRSEADTVGRVKAEAISQTETAPGRGTTAAPAPWLVSSPAALFDRPSLQEAFKVSAGTTDKGSEYSISIGSALFAYPTWATEGLEGKAAYNPTLKRGSLGLKYSLNWRDARVISSKTFESIDATRGQKFNECLGGDTSKLAKCQAEELNTIHEELAKIIAPAVSLGFSGQYDFEHDKLGDAAANLSAELARGIKIPALSLVANGDIKRTASVDSTVNYSLDWRAGLEALYGFSVRDLPFQVGFGGKYVKCIRTCTGDTDSVLFGPNATVTVRKDTVLGASVTWKGAGGDARHAFTGLSVSYSFDSPFKDKQ